MYKSDLKISRQHSDEVVGIMRNNISRFTLDCIRRSSVVQLKIDKEAKRFNIHERNLYIEKMAVEYADLVTSLIYLIDKADYELPDNAAPALSYKTHAALMSMLIFKHGPGFDIFDIYFIQARPEEKMRNNIEEWDMIVAMRNADANLFVSLCIIKEYSKTITMMYGDGSYAYHKDRLVKVDGNKIYDLEARNRIFGRSDLYYIQNVLEKESIEESVMTAWDYAYMTMR